MRGAVDNGSATDETAFANDYVSVIRHYLPTGGILSLPHGGMHSYALNRHTLKTTSITGGVTLHPIRAGDAN